MRYHLLMDADDTLWENNIYFEQAIHAFLTFLDHSRLSREEVRAVLDEVEHLMGYGSVNFTKSLVETYRRLAEKARLPRPRDKLLCGQGVQTSHRKHAAARLATEPR